MGIFVVTFKALTEYYLYMCVVVLYIYIIYVLLYNRLVLVEFVSADIECCELIKVDLVITAGHFPTSKCQCDIKEFVVRFFFSFFFKKS